MSAQPVAASPRANRLRSSRWRDPRLAIGLLLVAVSVVIGVEVVSHADDTVPVYVAAADAPAGAGLGAGSVRVAHVHFDSADQSRLYFDAAEPLPAHLRLTRDVDSGELLAKTAVTAAAARPVADVPLSVSAGRVPPGLTPGDHVDVWVADSRAGTTGRAAAPRRVLTDAEVADVGASSAALGTDGTILVVLGLGASERGLLAPLIAASTAGEVVLVGVGS